MKNFDYKINNWSLIDDDSFQYVKFISEDNYSLIEMCLINPDNMTYEVYTNEIDVNGYLECNRGEVIGILNAFGYEDIDDLIDKAEDASQIIAECIFEYYGSFEANRIFIGSEGECRSFISKYIKEQ